MKCSHDANFSRGGSQPAMLDGVIRAWSIHSLSFSWHHHPKYGRGPRKNGRI
jgi:hypothetical protein